MKAIMHTGFCVMLCAVALLAYAGGAFAATVPADAVAPTSQVEIINGLITDGPGIVYDNSDYNTFRFTYTMAVNPECCRRGASWAYTTECWEDDTFSDDFVGTIDTAVTVSCDNLSDIKDTLTTWQGSAMHAQCGTGSDWEMEYWFDSYSPICGADTDTDASGWQREQANQ